METENKGGHLLLTETECAKEAGIKNICSAEDILLDIKYLLRDFYTATFSQNGDGIALSLSNGQRFIISVRDVQC